MPRQRNISTTNPSSIGSVPSPVNNQTDSTSDVSASSSLVTNSQQQSKIPNYWVNDQQYGSMSVTNPKPNTNTSSNTALSYQQRTSINI